MVPKENRRIVTLPMGLPAPAYVTLRQPRLRDVLGELMYPITPKDPSVPRRTYDLCYVRTYVFYCYSVPVPSRPITKFSAHPDLRKLIRFVDNILYSVLVLFALTNNDGIGIVTCTLS